MFEALQKKGYQIEFVSHALAILKIDFPDAAAELEEVILNQSVPIEEIIGSGGGETKGTQRLRNGLTGKGWLKQTFTIKKTINDEPRESISHKVDHVRVVDRPDGKRYRIALWRLNGTTKTLSSIATWRISSAFTRKAAYLSGSSLHAVCPYRTKCGDLSDDGLMTMQ